MAATTVDENEDQVFSPHHDTDKIPAHTPDPKAKDVDDRFETVSEFESRIAAAIAMGESHLETTPEIIKIYCPRGFGIHPWFYYKGIMVYERGNAERISGILNEQIGKKTFGGSEAGVDHTA